MDEEDRQGRPPEHEDRPPVPWPAPDERDEADREPERRARKPRRDPVEDPRHPRFAGPGWQLRIPGAHLRDDLAVALLLRRVVPDERRIPERARVDVVRRAPHEV